RTGRAGASGDAVSLVSIDEADLLRGVQRLLKHAIPWTVEPGYEPDRNAEVQPLRGGPPELARARSHHQPNRRAPSGRGRSGSGVRSH
ncbi:MAG: ATP-dependent helicase RhlE, partial [Chloroflexota bacterium]|nr:ATP-dependent helicase RhlE [Chloroflexota bacterium]